MWRKYTKKKKVSKDNDVAEKIGLTDCGKVPVRVLVHYDTSLLSLLSNNLRIRFY